MSALKEEWRSAKGIYTTIALSAVLGMGLLLIQQRLQIDLHILIGCWIVSLVWWLAWALYNLFYWRKLQALLPLLRGEKAPANGEGEGSENLSAAESGCGLYGGSGV